MQLAQVSQPSPAQAEGSSPKYPPMLTQYLEYKERCADCLVLYQVGDFYELFFDDAVTAAHALSITLTTRDKNDSNPIPMCGVPVASVGNYIERLINLDYSVAVVSQTEVKKGGAIRKLERIITPGINILGETITSSAKIGALFLEGESVFFAFSDVQSGKIWIKENLDLSNVGHDVAALELSELVLPTEVNGRRIDRRFSWFRALALVLNERALKIKSFAAHSNRLITVKGFSALSPGAKSAASLLVNYIDETTIEAKLPIYEIAPKLEDRSLAIDARTRKNLELVKNTQDGTEKGTLFGYLNQTQSPGGTRTLRQWICEPQTEVTEIKARLEAVKALKDRSMLCSELREILCGFPDIERIMSRAELGNVNPRELGALRDTIIKLPVIKSSLGEALSFSTMLRRCVEKLLVDKECCLLLESLAELPPNFISEGEIFKAGFDTELDRLRELKHSGGRWMREFEEQERKGTGISSLKVRSNSVFGYYIEVTHSNLERVPEHYTRRQTTANAERFITDDLKRREVEINSAHEKQIALERRHFEELKTKLLKFTSPLRVVAQALCELDVLLSLATVAEREGLTEPIIDESSELEIVDGFHPILAKLLGGRFVKNSQELSNSKQNCLLVTGPNMGGKSTYLRQAALIIIMAQLGSFVPARSARIGVVDKIFARMGAGDNPLEGESTFMVEMREASFIISQASSRSFIVIDEIGRGTSTGDGLSIARAILEWIVCKLKCRTLFATHFHELTTLADKFKNLGNVSVGSLEGPGGVLFTHEIKSGPANKSYGLDVAKLSGLPEELLFRAREILKSIENQAIERGEARQLSIFGGDQKAHSSVVPPEDYANLKKLAELVQKFDLNNSAPLDALNYLARLKKELNLENK